jgi:hypothetical protein
MEKLRNQLNDAKEKKLAIFANGDHHFYYATWDPNGEDGGTLSLRDPRDSDQVIKKSLKEFYNEFSWVYFGKRP